MKLNLFLGVSFTLILACMTAEVPRTKESKLADASNELAFSLLKSLRNDKNVFISPFSISTALALVYLGAGGTTAQAMRRSLKYDNYGLTPAEVNEGFKSLVSRLTGNSLEYQFSSYNNLLVQQNFRILDTYKQAVKNYYSANVENVDFARQGEQVKARINADVERETRGKIKNFLEQPPSIETKLFLLNAVYFLGNWQKPFDPEFTREDTFYNNGVQRKKVQMMVRNGIYGYSESNDLKATIVKLPYNGSVDMIVVLPNSKTGIGELEQKITFGSLNQALTNTSRRIQLFIPKFNLSYSASLVQTLARLGLEELFGNSADLSNIAGRQNRLKVSSIFHKAVIEVNEKGTEAAAGTGIEIIPTSSPRTVKIDHPFIFFIQESQSGMILFSGRINEL